MGRGNKREVRLAGSLLNVSLEREFDARRLNEIVNDPDVFAPCFGTLAKSPVDLSGLVSGDGAPIVLAGEHGVILFQRIGQSDNFDVHAAVLPAGRGEWCRRAAQIAFNYLFLEIGAELAAFRCPSNNRAAIAGARMLGAKFHTRTEKAFPTPDGLVPFSVYVLAKRDWR